MTDSDPRRMARLLGYAGLIPFYLPAIATLLPGGIDSLILVLLVQVAYGAVIASFLGAVYWGVAIRDGGSDAGLLIRSVVPGLLGWAIVILALLAVPLWFPLALSILLFAGLYLNDRHAVQSGLLPDWYGALRLPLTLLVILSFLIGIAATL